MSFSQKDFADWQHKCRETAKMLEQEHKRITNCNSQIESFHEKEQTLDEKSSTTSIKILLGVCISQNTIAHLEAHERELKKELEELKDQNKHAFFHSLENNPRALVEQLTASLKELVQAEQEDYSVAQSDQFRYWLSEANREIEYISQQQTESKEVSDEKVIYQRKLWQLVGYMMHVIETNTNPSEQLKMLAPLKDKYPLSVKDCLAEFEHIKEACLAARLSLEAFLKKEREQFEKAKLLLQTSLAENRAHLSPEYRELYNKADQVFKQTNKQPEDVLDIKLKTKIMTSTDKLLQNPFNGENLVQKYKTLANTVREREHGRSRSLANTAGSMLIFLGAIGIFAGFLAAVMSGTFIPLAIGAGLTLFGIGLVNYAYKQTTHYKMHQIAEKGLPKEEVTTSYQSLSSFISA